MEKQNYSLEYYDEESGEWVETLNGLTYEEAEYNKKDFEGKDSDTKFRIALV